MQYLYNDGETYNFMHPETFEQYEVPKSVVGDAVGFLVEQDNCTLVLWNDNPISVTPPNHVILEVADTDPGLKGDTQGTGGKPATMTTGITVQVPLFVNIGDKLKIDSRT
jgi:elongation factor P